MEQFIKKNISHVAWALAATVTIVSLVAWGQRVQWNIFSVGNYELFPLFGLLAFSLMWSHYIIGGLKAKFGITHELDKRYFEYTAFAVLGALLLHPSLLVYQLYRDGFGLPLNSYNSYIAPGMAWAIYLGIISWLAFMSFELRRLYSKKKWWKYVLYANDVAIWGIFIHGLALGADLAGGWFRAVWILYGLALAAAFIAIYHKKWFAKNPS